ncbi:MAG TPA: methionine--tRNA ligase [Actinobacteria bacterium]|nr:methionine--tRNA ligase [Actinomycetota bacterium]
MEHTFYVTTPIYYVNDVPHIGHAYSTVVADVLARYHRLSGDDVFFLTGTDEHGQKVAKAAKVKGLEPQAHVDQMVSPFKDLWSLYNISNDSFIRTTEDRHQTVVQKIFQKLFDQGDIYKGVYEGWYCVHEETFWPEKQLKNEMCPECNRPVEWVKEDSYYFKTSKYKKLLLKHIEANPRFIRPEVRRNEVVSFLSEDLQDIAVSRTTMSWGVPVPFDDAHVVYVWFDALINYLTGVGYLQNDDQFSRFWPPVHIIGKDILKFHAVIWPSMLMALGIQLPSTIIATGFWTLGEKKISKSRGNVIDAAELADELSDDAVRYFLLREVPLGQDGEFTHKALVRRMNHDLANDFGNLIHRTLPMIERYRDGRVPAAVTSRNLTSGLAADVEDTINIFSKSMADLDPRAALTQIWKMFSTANKFIDQCAPWKLKADGRDAELDEVLWGLAETIRIAALLTAPFMPTTSAKIFEQLGLDVKPEEQPYQDFLKWGGLTEQPRIKPGAPLFPRVEIETQD